MGIHSFLLFISNLSMFEKEIIIDGRAHITGRLASKVAHELLRGQRLVIVRCEKLVLSGSLFRNNLWFHEFLRKANNTNPRRQFKHFRSPSRMFWRIIRGMLPTRPPEVKQPCRDSRSSKECHILMTKRRRWLSQWHSRF